ncbi:TPA: hypothetical protein ENS27_13505 [bacterium]|nr:hypothetical protein [bacterium]
MELSPQKKKIKFILILASLCIIAFVIGGALMIPLIQEQITAFFYPNYKIKKADKPLKTEAEIQEQMAEIIKSKDDRKCKEINNEIYQTACVNNIALNLAKETGDISYCQKIDDKLMSKKNCEGLIVMKKAIEKEDIKFCKEATDKQIMKNCEGTFWLALARKKKDIDMCQNIELEQNKANCHDSYLFDYEFSQNKIAFDCNKFKDANNKKDCQIFKKYFDKDDSLMCASFKGSLFPYFCK